MQGNASGRNEEIPRRHQRKVWAILVSFQHLMTVHTGDGEKELCDVLGTVNIYAPAALRLIYVQFVTECFVVTVWTIWGVFIVHIFSWKSSLL